MFWNLGKLNLAAKYEFRTKIELENESTNSANVDALMPAYADGGKVRSDIPALLTLGAQYQLTDAVRAMGGFHYYSLRQFVVAAGVLDIRTVSSVNDLDVAVFVLGDDAAGFVGLYLLPISF